MYINKKQVLVFKMPKIKWIERITNEAVLDRIKDKKELWCTVKVRRDKTIEYLLRHDSLNEKWHRRRR